MLYGVQYPISDQVLDKEFILPIGKAKIQRPGKHVTIVAHSRPVEAALNAANELAGNGIEAEIINLRSIRPLDVETIFKSVQKTNHLVTVEGGWPQSGMIYLSIIWAVENNHERNSNTRERNIEKNLKTIFYQKKNHIFARTEGQFQKTHSNIWNNLGHHYSQQLISFVYNGLNIIDNFGWILGIGSEICARIMEHETFFHLDAPVIRVTGTLEAQNFHTRWEVLGKWVDRSSSPVRFL